MPLTEWIYNSNTGAVNEFPTPIAETQLRLGTGWHGPFKSQQEAVDFYNNGVAANPGWKRPAGFGDQLPNAISSAGDRATKALDPLAKYDLNAWLLRIGEILLGLVLLGVGIAKLTGTTNMVAKAVKAAI